MRVMLAQANDRASGACAVGARGALGAGRGAAIRSILADLMVADAWRYGMRVTVACAHVIK